MTNNRLRINPNYITALFLNLTSFYKHFSMKTLKKSNETVIPKTFIIEDLIGQKTTRKHSLKHRPEVWYNKTIMATIYDIAKKCELSVSTVSKALNNDPHITDKTKAIVWEKARELSYVPNQAARSLSIGHSTLIGIIFTFRNDQSRFQNPFLLNLIELYKTKMAKRNYDVVFLSHKRGNQSTSYLEVCRRLDIHAVLVLGDIDSGKINELISNGIHVIAFEAEGPGIITITSDNEKITHELTCRLLSLGHRKLAFIEGNRGASAIDRREGFESAVASVPGAKGEILHVLNYDSASALLAAKKCLRNGITAILFPDDITAIVTINGLTNNGVQVPKEISITGFDGTDLGQTLIPQLTTVQQDIETISSRLAEETVESLKSSAVNSAVISVPSRIISGRSISCPCSNK